MRIRHTKIDDAILLYLFVCICIAQVMIRFEMTEYFFSEYQNPVTVNVIKHGVNIGDIMVFVSSLNYTEFENMGLVEPLGVNRPSRSVECKYLVTECANNNNNMLTRFRPPTTFSQGTYTLSIGVGTD